MSRSLERYCPEGVPLTDFRRLVAAFRLRFKLAKFLRQSYLSHLDSFGQVRIGEPARLRRPLSVARMFSPGGPLDAGIPALKLSSALSSRRANGLTDKHVVSVVSPQFVAGSHVSQPEEPLPVLLSVGPGIEAVCPAAVYRAAPLLDRSPFNSAATGIVEGLLSLREGICDLSHRLSAFSVPSFRCDMSAGVFRACFQSVVWGKGTVPFTLEFPQIRMVDHDDTVRKYFHDKAAAAR